MRTDFRINVPTPGDIITVTTRHWSHVLGDEGWREHTFRNAQVLESDRFDPPMTFRIIILEPTCYADSRVTERILAMKNVLSIKNGSTTFKRKLHKEHPNNAPKTTTKAVKRIISSSGDKHYDVLLENGVAVSCTCPGFHFRKTCRHLREAMTNEQSRTSKIA